MRSDTECTWQACLAALGNPDATLLQSTSHLPQQRVYRCGNNIAVKLQNLSIQSDGVIATGDLQNEYRLLAESLAGLRGIPQVRRLVERPEFIALEYEFVPGEPLMPRIENSTSLTFSDICKVCVWLVPLLFRVSMRGVAHNDLKPWNIIRTIDNRLALIDFDRASKTSIPNALYRNFLALKGHTQCTSFAYIVGKFLKPMAPKRLVRWARRRFGYAMMNERD